MYYIQLITKTILILEMIISLKKVVTIFDLINEKFNNTFYKEKKIFT